MTLPFRYVPTPVPRGLPAIPRYLDAEFRRLGGVVAAIADRRPDQVLFAESFVDQTPGGAGAANAIYVTFGAAQYGPNDPVQLMANGEILFHQAGTYALDTRYTFSRSSPNQIAYLFIRAVINGTQFGNPIGVSMNEAQNSAYEQYTIQARIPSGTSLRWQLARGTSGANDGYLESLDSGIGWGATPSALTRILRY